MNYSVWGVVVLKQTAAYRFTVMKRCNGELYGGHVSKK